MEKNQDDELVVLFDGLWGCKIELIFSQDVTYHNKRSIEQKDAWWSSSSMDFEEDSIVFVDEDNYNLGSSLSNYYTWFKAKQV